jgi:hypothetical protein
MFESTTPAAPGKCALYVYYFSGDIKTSPPLLIDEETAGKRMDQGGYLRREVSCGPHIIALGYPRGLGLVGPPCGYRVTLDHLQGSRNESKVSYCAGTSLALIDGSAAFLRVIQERRGTAAPLTGAKMQRWSFVHVDQATALSELKSMKAND